MVNFVLLKNFVFIVALGRLLNSLGPINVKKLYRRLYCIVDPASSYI